MSPRMDDRDSYFRDFFGTVGPFHPPPVPGGDETPRYSARTSAVLAGSNSRGSYELCRPRSGFCHGGRGGPETV